MKIIPAILASDQAQFKKQWHKVAPFFDYIQIDIMDGQFVSSKNNLKPHNLQKVTAQHQLEIHLMVNDVPRYINLWETLPNVRKILWHYEAVPDDAALLELLDYLKKQKIKGGLAINPHTPLNKIKNIAEYFDTIQVMGVEPGAQGRPLAKNSLTKIKQLKRKYPKQKIAIDGGVNDKNFLKIKQAGADIIALGHYLQSSHDPQQALKKLSTKKPR